MQAYQVLLAGVIFACGGAAGLQTARADCGQTKRIFYQIPGNLSIAGIFNVHGGEDCGDYVANQLEQAAATLWTISLLNQRNYLPDYTIGVTIFDGCEDADDMRKAYVNSLIVENCQKPNVTAIGTMVSEDVRRVVEPLAGGLNKTLSPMPAILNTTYLVSMVGQLLQVMSINTVHRVAAESQPLLTQFGRTMTDLGVCIYDQVLIDDRHALNNEILEPPEGTESKIVSKGAPVIVVIASTQKLREHFENLNDQIFNMTDIIWIVAATDGATNINPDVLPDRTFILSPVLPKTEELHEFLSNQELVNDPLNHRQPSKSPLFLAAASTVLDILKPIKELYDKCSTANETCSQVADFVESLNSGKSNLKPKPKSSLTKIDIQDIYKAIQLPPDEEAGLYSLTKSRVATDDVALFQILDTASWAIDPKLLIFKERRKRSIVRVGIEDIQKRGSEQSTTTATTATTTTTSTESLTEMTTKKNSEWSARGKHPCHEALGNLPSECGICLNFVKYLSRVAQEKQTVQSALEVGWRFETWVTINASVAAMGSLCAVAIFIFVVSRICMGDVLEGSPALSFFLLIAVLITYASTLPFSFQSAGSVGDWTISALVCDLRVAGPPLCYSILFSIMLSRSLMLAASDQDGGFMSHVNGYLQAVAIFFICAVQFAISGEYWLFNSYILSSYAVTSCQDMYESNRLIFLLAYNIFILVIMVTVIPFMIRSKRNYKEGLFFSIAIALIFLLWCAWIPLFYIFPEYQDAAVVLGLTGTPTLIILCIFIPRTYLMTTAIVRDRIVNTLPPLVHNEHQFRSTQALYDTLNLAAKAGGPHQPNFYSVNPMESGSGTPHITPGQYYSSNALKSQKPKTNNQNNQASHCDTPENAYQAFDSPVHSPSRITRF